MRYDPLEGVRPSETPRPMVSIILPRVADRWRAWMVVIALVAVAALIAAGMGFYFAVNRSAKTPRAPSTVPATGAQATAPIATSNGEPVVKQGPRPADPSPLPTPVAAAK